MSICKCNRGAVIFREDSNGALICKKCDKPAMAPDMVNHPPHYTAHPSGVEVIEITEHLNFCLGNAVKYILRADHKGDPETDIKKAIWYLERELKRRK